MTQTDTVLTDGAMNYAFDQQNRLYLVIFLKSI